MYMGHVAFLLDRLGQLLTPEARKIGIILLTIPKELQRLGEKMFPKILQKVIIFEPVFLAVIIFFIRIDPREP